MRGGLGVGCLGSRGKFAKRVQSPAIFNFRGIGAPKPGARLSKADPWLGLFLVMAPKGHSFIPGSFWVSEEP